MDNANNNRRPKQPTAEMKAFRLQRTTGRRAALQYLYSCDIQNSWNITPEDLESFQNLILDEEDLPKDDATLQKVWAYATALITGTIGHKEEIDQLITNAAQNWTLSRMNSLDLAILRLAVYEIRFETKMTPAIAINEAVELAKEFGQTDSARFVNGVLDQVRRQNS